MSCHDTSNAKDTTNQKPGTGVAENTPKIAGADYDVLVARLLGHDDDHQVELAVQRELLEVPRRRHGDEVPVAGRSIADALLGREAHPRGARRGDRCRDEAQQALCFKCHNDGERRQGRLRRPVR